MTCPISITRLIRSQTFTNWARNVEFTANESYRPVARGEIVEAIRIAEDEGLRIKWSGSRWSFMPTFVSNDIVIESDKIFGLVEVDIRTSDVENPEKILSHLTLREGIDRPTLFHLKGGTKIFNVNRLLHGLDMIPDDERDDEFDNNVTHIIPDDEFRSGCDESDEGDEDCGECNNMFAMPTLGGSGGQSIAGALSTGTHGGDILVSPIADAVAAIHLIGPGGQEWWIEKSEGITAGTEQARHCSLFGFSGVLAPECKK